MRCDATTTAAFPPPLTTSVLPHTDDVLSLFLRKPPVYLDRRVGDGGRVITENVLNRAMASRCCRRIVRIWIVPTAQSVLPFIGMFLKIRKQENYCWPETYVNSVKKLR